MNASLSFSVKIGIDSWFSASLLLPPEFQIALEIDAVRHNTGLSQLEVQILRS